MGKLGRKGERGGGRIGEKEEEVKRGKERKRTEKLFAYLLSSSGGSHLLL